MCSIAYILDMRKRSSIRKSKIQHAPFSEVVREPFVSYEPGVKNSAAVALGRLGGIKGGPARAKKLTPAQRSRIARRAAMARWGKQ